MKRLMTGLALIALAAAGPLAAKPMKTMPAPDYAAALADPARTADNRKLDEGRMPAAVLAFADIRAGQTVADYQAGGGYYTELLSRAVGPKGRVYALTAPPGYQAKPWNALVAAHPNVVVIAAPTQALSLAPGSVDTLFLHLVYHDLYFVSEKYGHPPMDVPATLKSWFAAVRPGGHVVIVDHAGPAGDPRAVVDRLHRIDPARVTADMTAAGFVPDGASDVLHRSDDDQSKNVFDPAIRGKTDRFMLKFHRP